MRNGSALLIRAVYLMILVVIGLVIFFLIHNNAATSIDANVSINDRWWGIPLVAAATLCLIGWVLYKDRNEFESL